MPRTAHHAAGILVPALVATLFALVACGGSPGNALRHSRMDEGCYLFGLFGDIVALPNGGIAIRPDKELVAAGTAPDQVELAWPSYITSSVGADGQVTVHDAQGKALLVSGTWANVPGGFEDDYFAACPDGISQ